MCPQLLYVVAWTSVLFPTSCSSVVSDGSGTQLEGNLIRDVLLPTSFPNWQKRVGGQLKTWASTIKDDIAALSGPQVVGLRRWNRDWLAISCDLAQDRRTWAAMVRDAVLAQEEAGSTRPGWKLIQVKVSNGLIQKIKRSRQYPAETITCEDERFLKIYRLKPNLYCIARSSHLDISLNLNSNKIVHLFQSK